MPEIKEEVYKALFRIMQCHHVGPEYRKDCTTVENAIARIEAERKPKGYLEKLAEEYKTGVAGLDDLFKRMQTDIARIFEEEWDKWYGKSPMTMKEFFKHLEHCICREGRP